MTQTDSKLTQARVIFEREYGKQPYFRILRMLKEELGLAEGVAVTYYSLLERERVPPNVSLYVTEGELEIARKAVEDELIDLRDRGILILRNNGLVVKSKEGEESNIIRLSIEDAISIGIEAINKSRGNPV